MGDPAAMKQGFAGMLKSVTALNEAGAHILVGTDTPNPFVVPGFSLHEELQLLVEAGLTPFEVMRAATHGAAEFLGKADEFGTITIGKQADLVLIDDNPLTDVANASKISGVVLRGKWLPKTELDTMLKDVADAYEKESEQSQTNKD